MRSNASIRAECELSCVSWIYVRDPDDGSNGDGTGGGDECADRAMHLARLSLAEGGDSEIGGDGDGVGMARSLQQTSTIMVEWICET
ncbi:hypothetical protein Tco_0409422 [Tanacetum coccineum]